MNRCGFCGRENAEQSTFCIVCGKPMVKGGTRVIAVPDAPKPAPPAEGSRASSHAVRPRAEAPAATIAPLPAPDALAPTACPKCGKPVDSALPYCPHCGTRLGGTPARGGGTAAFAAHATGVGPRLSLLDDTGGVKQSFTLDRGEAIFGRSEGDIRFPDDVFLSPVHAHVAMRDGLLFVRDLGSRNGTWVFTDGPYRLQDGDTILVGSQLIRFRRLGYPGPHPPEADQTRRLGSFTPSADIAMLAQLRADGSARDSLHLSPARHVKIGRDQGDWVFPYDQTMSGKHAEVRSEDLEFIVLDDGSRNGIAVAVRGERSVRAGQRFLIGDQTLLVESV